MISTDITGSANGDASQVFNLLTVVANPDLYGEKLKTIVQATEEHKKYVELLAPASEIVQMREAIETDKANAVKLVEDAKKEAQAIKDEAQANVEAITSDANAFAAKTKKDISDTQATVRAKLKDVEGLKLELQTQIADVAASADVLEAKKVELDSAIKAAAVEKEKFLSLQKAMSDKVKAFAEDLLK